MAKEKKRPAGRRRRKRNPRTLSATGRPRRPPTLQEFLAATHEALSEARALVENAETEARAGAAVRDYLLRVVATLEDLSNVALMGQVHLRIFAQAATTFLPLLSLSWLPEDPQSFTRELSEAERQCLETMRRQRVGDAAGSQAEATRGRWTGLLDVLTESVEVFIRFGYSDGILQCFALNEALIAGMGDEPSGPFEM